MKFPTVWTLLPTLLLAACAGLPSTSAVINPDFPAGIVSSINAPRIEMFQGRPVWAHYNAQNHLVFQAFGDKEQVLSQDSPAGAKLTNLTLHTDEKGIYAFWRPKLQRAVEGVGRAGDKLIYVRASQDGKTFGPTMRLNQKGGAFVPRVAGNGQGSVYAVWVDERDGGGGYDIYLNVSHDAGQSWAPSDIRIDPGRPGGNPSSDPMLAVEKDKVFVAWREGGETAQLMVRVSLDGARNWEKPVEIARDASNSTGLRLVKLPPERGNRLVLYWFNQQEIFGAYSEDDGRGWNKFNPLPTVTDMAELNVIQDPSGKVLLVAGLRPDHGKEDLVFAASEDGIHFGKPVRLDTNIAHSSTSTLPEISADGKGRILVAWQDRRAFRDEVYFNYSLDDGKTWLTQDLPLGGRDAKHMQYPRLTSDGQGGFHVAAVGYDHERREKGKSYLFHIVPGEPWPAAADKRPDQERLRARVAKFWDDRTRADWGGNYDLMDPFFRGGTPRDYYVVTQFKTIYHDFEIKDAKVTENSAQVTVKFTMEVPQMVLQSGKTISVAKREEEIFEEWIWIDDDWYRVFKDIAGGSFIPR